MSPAVAGAVFAAILPVMNAPAATPEFARAVELLARERFSEPVCLLREPLEEILNILRPGYLWNFEALVESAGQVPTQLPRTAQAPSRVTR